MAQIFEQIKRQELSNLKTAELERKVVIYLALQENPDAEIREKATLKLKYIVDTLL